MSLAFVADLCIAAEDARFTPAYAKLGVSPDGGGTVGVVGRVGTRRALQIFLAEDSFSAAQAHDWGLVAKVVPAAELKAATRDFAQRLAQNAPAAIAATKALIYQAPNAAIEDHAARRRARRHHRLHAYRRRDLRGAAAVEQVHRQHSARRNTGSQIIPAGKYIRVPAGDLKQPTDSGITCFGSHSTTFGKINREADGEQKHDVDRQRRAQRLAKLTPTNFDAISSTRP